MQGIAMRIVGLGVVVWGMLAGVAAAQSPIEGVWRTKLLSEVTIAPCPEGYCGTLSKIIVPEHIMEGENRAAVEAMRTEDFVDYNNKDPQLRQRPLLGLQILTLTPGKSPAVYDGEIYNPEDGNTYSGYLEVLGPDRLRLNGCVLFNVLCRGEEWERVPATR